jgi:hypothetical protein
MCLCSRIYENKGDSINQWASHGVCVIASCDNLHFLGLVRSTMHSYHSVAVSLVTREMTFSKQPWDVDMLGVAFVVPECKSTRPNAGSGDTLVPKDSKGAILQRAVSSQLAAAYHQTRSCAASTECPKSRLFLRRGCPPWCFKDSILRVKCSTGHDRCTYAIHRQQIELI